MNPSPRSTRRSLKRSRRCSCDLQTTAGSARSSWPCTTSSSRSHTFRASWVCAAGASLSMNARRMFTPTNSARSTPEMTRARRSWTKTMPTLGANFAAFADAPQERRRESRLLLRRIGVSFALCVALTLAWRAAERHPSACLNPVALAFIGAFLRGLFPPDLSPAFLRIVLAAIAQTVAIAVAGTALSILIGLPLGALSTATLYRRGVLLAGEKRGAGWWLLFAMSHATRALLGFLRAVPDLVWGILFVVAVGLGSLAGTLALAISYGGVLGRVYAHVFEEVDSRPLEALHASGATRTQVFLRAIWPQAKPNLTAYTLYSFECCVRAASVLGFVGAGGIGYEINLSMRLFQYDQVLTLIMAFIALLTATDMLSRKARRRLRGTTSSARSQFYLPSTPNESARRRAGAATVRLRNSALVLISALLLIWSLYATGFANGALLE